MKDTGIIRHLDELGRVVIPKEIRKKLKIKNGDPVEIFTNNNSVMLKKYSPLYFDISPIKAFINILRTKYDCDVVITDNESVIYSTNKSFNNSSLSNVFIAKVKNLLNKELPKELNIELANNVYMPSNCYISKIYADYVDCGFVIVLAKYIRKQEIDLSNMIVGYINELLKSE